MVKVIFDSSFLMAIVERPTTWFEDIAESLGKFEPVLLGCVSDELKTIAAGEGKRARSSRVALELAGEFVNRKCGGGSPDDEIVSAALEMRAAVATTDGALAGTLRKLHVKVIELRLGRVFVP